jgi:hypothetical protein
MALTKTTNSMIVGAAINAADFGAVGDGTTNNTPFIQAAIDYAEDLGGGRVVLPVTDQNVFLILGVLSVKSNIIFDGQFNTIKIKDETTSFDVLSANNVLIENLIINGNADNYTSGGSQLYPFIVRSSTDVTVRNCIMFNMEFAGISFNQGGPSNFNRRCIIEDCYIYDVGVEGNAWSYGNGIAVTGGEDIVIRNNFINNVDFVGGITLEGTRQVNILIEGNRVSNCTGLAGGIKLYAGGVDTPGTNVVIRDNIVTNHTGTQAAIYIQDGSNVIVTNNMVSDCDRGFIEVINRDNVVLDGNTIKRCVTGGFKFNSSFSGQITNNYFEASVNAVRSTFDDKFYIESSAELSSPCMVTGNIAVNCPGEAFLFAPRSPVIFTGNTIKNCQLAQPYVQGFGVNVIAVPWNRSIVGNNIILDTIGSYGSRFYGFYNFEGGAAVNLVYLPDNWKSVSDGMPRYSLYLYNGWIKTTEAIASAFPTVGTHLVGDIAWNASAASGGTPGWMCTTAGTPGTWKAMANLA